MHDQVQPPGFICKIDLLGLVIAVSQVAQPAKQVAEVNDRDQRPATSGISYLMMKLDGLGYVGRNFPGVRKHTTRVTMSEPERGLLGFVQGNLLASGFPESRAKLLGGAHGINKNPS